MSRNENSAVSHVPRVLFTGPVPTPVGGVSTHIQRLSSWLTAHGIVIDLVDDSRHKKPGIYNIRSLRFLPYVRFLTRCNVAHIHSGVHLLRILHIVACRLFGVRVIVTIHGWRAAGLTAAVNRMFLGLADEVILVSEQINDSLRLSKYQLLPAFLPPMARRQGMPEVIETFVKHARARGCSVLCASASAVIEHNGQDLYGLDLCIELMERLACRQNINAALVFVVPTDASNNRRYADAARRISERSLERHVCLYNDPVDFVALMNECDLVLRPTNTDGDAVTVREALYFGIPVIASDVVQRPLGTILFRNRDVEDLMRCTLRVLDSGTRRVAPAQSDYDSYFERYLDLYTKVLNH